MCLKPISCNIAWGIVEWPVCIANVLIVMFGLQGGALPVFVVDGNPPPEKLGVRMERFGRMFNPPISLPFSQVDISADEPDIARNSAFQQSIDECVVGAQLPSCRTENCTSFLFPILVSHVT